MATKAANKRSASISSAVLPFINCSICLGEFKIPKLLPCSHTFCLSCLQQYDSKQKCDKGKVKCAICRKISKLPAGGYKKLLPNLTVQGLLDIVERKPKMTALPMKKEKPSAPASKASKTIGKSAAPVPAPRGKASKVSKSKEAAVEKTKPKAKAAAVEKTKPKAKAAAVEKTKPKAKANGKGTAGTSGQKNKKAQAIAVAKALSAAKAKGLSVNSRQLPLDRNRNISVEFSDEYSPVNSSDEYSSDEESFDSEDSESETSSSCYTDDSADSDSEVVPPTPGIVTWEGLDKGDQVYVFGPQSEFQKGTIRHMEMFKGTMYCGLELPKEMPSVTTDLIEEMDGTYLHYWLGDNAKACTVVRIDQCCPVNLVQSILND